MRYHKRTLKLLGNCYPAGEPERARAAEARLGITLPASVREWYADLDGRSVLGTYSNDDCPVPPEEFECMQFGGMTLIKVLVENQAVCWWGFVLDGSDDPAVYVNMDPPPDDLHLYSDSFSEFTYVRVFDNHGLWDEDRMSMHICGPLAADDLVALEDRFNSEPKSDGWPASVTHRYSDPLGRITIWSGPLQSDWILSADSGSALGALRERVSSIWRNPIQ